MLGRSEPHQPHLGTFDHKLERDRKAIRQRYELVRASYRLMANGWVISQSHRSDAAGPGEAIRWYRSEEETIRSAHPAWDSVDCPDEVGQGMRKDA